MNDIVLSLSVCNFFFVFHLKNESVYRCILFILLSCIMSFPANVLFLYSQTIHIVKHNPISFDYTAHVTVIFFVTVNKVFCSVLVQWLI